MFGVFNRLCRRRNESQYPHPGSPTITGDDADDCIQAASTIIDVARMLLDSGKLSPYE